MTIAIESVTPDWQCLFWIPLQDFQKMTTDAARLQITRCAEELASSELAALRKSVGDFALGRFKARAERQCQLHILWKKGVVIGTLFIVSGKHQKFQHVVLTEHDAMILDARIDPAFRGQGLYSVFLNLSLSFMRDEGVERVYVATSERNEPSLRTLRRLGFIYLLRYKSHRGKYSFDQRPL